MNSPSTKPERKTGTPTVSVIFVTMNVATFISSALEAIQKQDYPAEALRTVLVDNGSVDNTVAFVREHFPWVEVVSEPTNRGFAGANNIGMRLHNSDYYALVNGDAQVAPDWVSTLVAVMEADPTIGVTGSKIYYGPSNIIQHAGGFVRDNGLTYHLGDQEEDHGQCDTPLDVDYVMGAAFMLRGTLARQLDYLPEVYYPIYFEEADYCAQVRRSGHRVVYIPKAVAHHDDKKRPDSGLTFKFLKLYHKHRFLYVMRNMLSAEDHRKFRKAERLWLRTYFHPIFSQPALFYFKLLNGRLILKNLWLLIP